MKARMRTLYYFHEADNGRFIGWGDRPDWAQKVREAWGDAAVETQERVMYVTTRTKKATR